MKEKLFISVRDDGVATRLLSILNAMYLADKFYDIRNMRFFGMMKLYYLAITI
ncbi:hypothetical protein B6672_007775 [Campylobacter jejuni]